MDQGTKIAQLVRAIELSEQDITLAADGWTKTQQALERGLGAPENQISVLENSQHRERYLSIARYCDDARDLASRYSIENEELEKNDNTIFCIDPHIFRAFSEYWDKNRHKGFYFTNLEERSLASDIGGFTDQDKMLVYQTVLQDFDVALLDAGRAELSDLVAYLSETSTSNDSQSEGDAQHLLDHIRQAIILSQFRKNDNPEEFVRERFEELVILRGIPALKQKVALARLISIFKGNNFFSPEGAIRKYPGDGNTEAITLFSDLYRELRNNPGILNRSRNRFAQAYQKFLNTTELIGNRGSRLRRTATGVLRGGELNDLNAIHEAHVLNACMSIAGLPHTFRYVTLSTRMYNFVRMFNRSAMHARLIHPRTALVYARNDLAKKHAETLSMVLSNAIAFGSGIPKNDQITPHELDQFEEKLKDVLEATRQTFSYSAPARGKGMDHLVSGLDDYFKGFGGNVLEDYNALREGIRPAFREKISETGDAFEQRSVGLSEHAWGAYNSFVTEENFAESKVVIRKFRFADNEKTDRYTVIPISGGFRHLFILHNSFLGEVLHAFSDGTPHATKMSDVLKAVDNAAGKLVRIAKPNSLESRKARATQFFTRACMAASNREWTLVHALTTQACDALRVKEGLGFVLSDLGSNPDLATKRARAAQIDREILFLRHLAKRAIGEASDAFPRRANWLRKAGEDLRESSLCTVELPKGYADFGTPFSPTSLRQALAAVGLLMENLFHCSSPLVSVNMVVDPLLVATDRLDIAWYDLPVLTRHLSVSEPQLFDELVAATRTLCVRTDQCFSLAGADGQTSHNIDFWRFVALRAYSMLLLLSSFKAMNKGKLSSALASLDDVARTRILADGHLDFVCTLLGEDASEDQHRTIGNPFTDGLIGIHEMLEGTEFEGDHFAIINFGKVMMGFGRVDASCNRLDRFGFPRGVLRMAKELFAKPVHDHLALEYELPPGSAHT